MPRAAGPSVPPAVLSTAAGRWAPGSTVVVRQHRSGRFRAVTPMVVVDDAPDRVVLFVPQGTTFLAPADAAGRVTRSIRDEAGVTPDRWRDRAALHVVPGGAGFSVMLRWGRSFDDFSGYYVNVQEPLRRTAVGFDSMDQTLDVVIDPDRRDVQVKDEAELRAAARHGFFAADEVAAIQAAARRATVMVLHGEPPLDEDWAAWRPDPAWSPPDLPAGWDTVPLSPSPWREPAAHGPAPRRGASRGGGHG